jgi:hypothetical protein
MITLIQPHCVLPKSYARSKSRFLKSFNANPMNSCRRCAFLLTITIKDTVKCCMSGCVTIHPPQLLCNQ